MNVVYVLIRYYTRNATSYFLYSQWPKDYYRVIDSELKVVLTKIRWVAYAQIQSRLCKFSLVPSRYEIIR